MDILGKKKRKITTPKQLRKKCQDDIGYIKVEKTNETLKWE